MNTSTPTYQRDSKGRRLWNKVCNTCGKITLTRFEGVGRPCRSCSKIQGKGFPKGTLVDPEFQHLAKWSWRIINSGYVYHTTLGLLHRLVMNAPIGLEVDHKNDNKLDCRKENLQLLTSRQNSLKRERSKRANKPKDVDFF